MQVHVRDVGTDVRRSRQADLGVEVGAVHVHLAALGVDCGADLTHVFFVDAVGRRVGDHQAGQPVAGLGGLALEVLEIDVAALVAFDDDHTHADHLRRGGIGAVRRGRDQADVALPFTAALVILADCDQAGVFALGTRLGCMLMASKPVIAQSQASSSSIISL